MADEGSDDFDDSCAKELERLLAAKEEEEALPPEEPESVADAFLVYRVYTPRRTRHPIVVWGVH
ncbi:MAG: hypothetical protein MKZ56_02170 [Candidatus Thalassarchaeum sp.]|nr:hypothetical protein [Candidatus Thalassarchaeum sp.]